MNTIQTKFKIGDIAFCFDKFGNIKERTVEGYCTSKLVNRPQFTSYSFLKDNLADTDFTGELPRLISKNDFFWMKEDKLFKTKEELIESLK